MKPELKRDWVGRYVRLLRKLETKNGTIFEKGEAMRVLVDNSEGLELQAAIRCNHCARRHNYRAIIHDLNIVSLLPADFDPDFHPPTSKPIAAALMLRVSFSSAKEPRCSPRTKSWSAILTLLSISGSSFAPTTIAIVQALTTTKGGPVLTIER